MASRTDGGDRPDPAPWPFFELWTVPAMMLVLVAVQLVTVLRAAPARYFLVDSQAEPCTGRAAYRWAGREALALALSVYTGLSIAGALGDPPPPFESWPEEGEGGAAADNLTWFYDLAFTLALICSPSFSAALRWSVWTRWTRWSVWQSVGRARHWVVLLAFCLVIVGGAMNRLRGGWAPFHPDGKPGGDFEGRMLLGVPTGLLVLLLTGQPVLALHSALMFYQGTLMGWGCYQGMGRGAAAPADWSDCARDNKRWGMFDFFLGEAQEDWAPCGGAGGGVPGFEPCSLSNRKYRRDFCAMALRGLAWTLPPGAAMHRAGYGPTVALGGVMYALSDDLSYRLQEATHLPGKQPSDHDETPGAAPYLFSREFLLSNETTWGAYLWLLVIASILAGARAAKPGPEPLPEPAAPIGYRHSRLAETSDSLRAIRDSLLVREDDAGGGSLQRAAAAQPPEDCCDASCVRWLRLAPAGSWPVAFCRVLDRMRAPPPRHLTAVAAAAELLKRRGVRQ